MRGSELVAMLPENDVAKRDALLLDAVERGRFVAEWIDVVSGPLTIRVLRTALRWGEPGDSVALGVTPRTQQQIADLLNAVLLTPKLVDVCASEAMRASGLVRPKTQPINSTTSGYVKHSKAIDADLPPGYTGIAAGWKDWCVSADVFTKIGFATNYGWHIPRGLAKAWSPIPVEKLEPAISDPTFLVVQGPHEAHTTGEDVDGDGHTDSGHGDYSQFVRVALRTAKWYGTPVDLADVYTGKHGPEATACASHEGALAGWRLPGVDHSTVPKDDAKPIATTRPTLKRGSKGLPVEEWQRTISVTADGDFGPCTEAKTKVWQTVHGLTADGIVGPKSWTAAGLGSTAPAPAPAPATGEIKFVKAQHFTPTQGRKIDLVVLHTAEVPETLTSAEAVAGFFSKPGVYPKGHKLEGQPRKVSAHACVDADSTVQCVLDRDVAFAAPGANNNGIQIELSGFARQTSVDWADDFSTKTLARASVFVARVLRENGIPCQYVDWIALKRGDARGITTHDDVSRAFKRSDHTDPGKGFPMPAFVEAVRALL